MSIKHILNKLATKETLKGNIDFAYNLVTIAEEKSVKEASKNQTVLQSMVQKYAQGNFDLPSDGTSQTDGILGDPSAEMPKNTQSNMQMGDFGIYNFNGQTFSNPFDPNSPEGKAWQQGFEAASTHA